MAKKLNFLKNLLTTASALAVVTGAANAYAGSALSTGAAASDVNVGTNFLVNGVAPVAGVPVGSNIIFGINQPMAMNRAGNFPTINAYGFTQNITVTAAASGSIVNDISPAAQAAALAAFNIPGKTVAVAVGGVGANAKLNFIIGANGAFTFNAIDALGTVTFADAAAKATFAGDNTTATGVITAKAANGGIVEVNATNVTFKGDIGTNAAKIDQFKIIDGKSATLDANLFANGAVTIGSAAVGGELTVNKGKNITANDIAGSAAGKGKISFKVDSLVTTIAGKGIGGAFALEEINIGAGTVQLTTGTIVKATTINLTEDNSVLKLNTVATLVTGDIFTAKGGKGKITLGGNNDVFTGNIGKDIAVLEAIEFGVNTATFLQAAGKDLEINATSFTGTGTAFFNAEQGKNITINTDIGTSASKFAAVKIRDLGNAGAVTATLAKGKTINAITFDIAPLAQDNILILSDGSAIKGSINAGSAGRGILQVAGDSTVNNVNGANNIKQIQFTEAGKTLTIENGGLIKAANGINFKADGILKYTGTDNFDLTATPITVLAAAGGTGSIIANSGPSTTTVTVNAAGDPTVADKSLKLLQVNGGAQISLTNGANIAKVDIGSQNATLTLATANSSYVIGKFAHGNGSGILAIANVANVTLAKGSVFSDSNNTLGQVTFLGDQVLNVGDGVNLYTTNGVLNSGANAGTLKFLGSSVIGGTVGTVNQKINAIEVTGKNSIVGFKNAVNANGNVTISDGATAQFNDAINVAQVNGAVGGKGTLSIVNATAVTTAAAIGNTKLEAVSLGGTDVTFSDVTFDTANLTFTNTTGATKATLSALGLDALQNTKITTPSTNQNHDIVLSKGQNQRFNAQVGTAIEKMGTFTMVYNTVGAVDSTITINTDFYGSIATDTKEKGTVDFVKNNSLAINLGAKDTELLATNFKQNATVLGNIYSKDITVDAGKVATFKGTVNSSANGGMKLNNGSSAIFADGATSNTAINGNAAGDGTVTFQGDATISKEIGGTKVSSVIFSGAGKTAKLGADIKSNNISITNGVTARATTDVDITGATDISGSTLDLGTSEVTFRGGASKFSGTSNLKLTVNDDDAAGSIVIDGVGAVLNLDNAAAINLTINDEKADLPDAEAGQTYNLFSIANNGELTDKTSKITVTPSTNKFVQWSYADKVLTRTNVAGSALSTAVASIKDSSLTADALALGNVKNTGEAKAVVADFAKIANDTTLADAVRRLTKPIETSSAVMVNVASAGKQVVTNRLGALSPTPGIQLSDNNTSGVSAGDEAKFGAWVSPFLSQNNQSAYKGSAGYKATSVGATVGFDTMANADMTLGLAGTYAKTDVKHKNFKSSDKTKADTFMFSIYGIQQLTNDWFLQAVASFSSSKVKNTERRVTSAGNQTAKGSFDTTTYGGDAMVGYNHNISGATITPMFGVNFTRINDGGYKETGTTNQNLTITKKAVNKFELVGGVKAQMNSSNMNGIDVTPEIHGFVKHDLIGKNPTTTAKLDGLANPFASKSAKAIKTSYNVGFGVNAVSGMYEYGAGYDLSLANKFVGHQGTLKVRVNF